jgi:hypothetical protein
MTDARATTSTLTVNIFDGTRSPLKPGVSVLYRVFDGNQKEVASPEKEASSVKFTDLQFFNNFGDNHRVVVSAKKYLQAGYTPIPLTPVHPTELDLMLLPKRNTLNFADAKWAQVKKTFPFLGAGVSESGGKDRYSELMEEKPKALAALLNICTATSQIMLRGTDTPLSFIKELVWDDSMTQDRFFAYADATLVDQVRSAAHRGMFAPEFGAGAFHPGATASWKQVLFGQGDVQLTFHENNRKRIDGTDCVLFEPDIDLFKDLASHFLLEVVPNKITRGLTNPEAVYVLRWIAGRKAGVPDFNPPFTIVEA